MARQSTVKQPRLTSGGQANQTPASTTEQTEGSSEPDDESDEQGSNEEEESLPTEIPAWHPITDFQVEFDVLLEDGSESRLTERQVQTVSSGPVYRWWQYLNQSPFIQSSIALSAVHVQALAAGYLQTSTTSHSSNEDMAGPKGRIWVAGTETLLPLYADLPLIEPLPVDAEVVLKDVQDRSPPLEDVASDIVEIVASGKSEGLTEGEIANKTAG
ncbi:hypothetical protein ACHAQD_011285 [Fusarium lateritium]